VNKEIKIKMRFVKEFQKYKGAAEKLELFLRTSKKFAQN
jgi:hypothetical protein